MLTGFKGAKGDKSDLWFEYVQAAEACAAICRATTGCKAFSHIKRKDKKPNCYLRKADIKAMGSSKKGSKGAISGDACFGTGGVRKRCDLNKCICPHGTGAVGQNCPKPGWLACQRCDAGYLRRELFVQNHEYQLPAKPADKLLETPGMAFFFLCRSFFILGQKKVLCLGEGTNDPIPSNIQSTRKIRIPQQVDIRGTFR